MSIVGTLRTSLPPFLPVAQRKAERFVRLVIVRRVAPLPEGSFAEGNFADIPPRRVHVVLVVGLEYAHLESRAVLVDYLGAVKAVELIGAVGAGTVEGGGEVEGGSQFDVKIWSWGCCCISMSNTLIATYARDRGMNPPGCSLRNFVTLYTTPSMAIQASVSVLWRASSSRVTILSVIVYSSGKAA